MLKKLFSSFLKAAAIVTLSVASTLITIIITNNGVKPSPTYLVQTDNGLVGINTKNPESELHIKAVQSYAGNADIQLETYNSNQSWNLSAINTDNSFSIYNKTKETNPFIISPLSQSGLLALSDSSVNVGGQLIVKYPGARIRIENTSIPDTYIDMIMATQKEHGYPDGTLLFYNDQNKVIMSLSKDGTLTVNKLVYKELSQQ